MPLVQKITHSISLLFTEKYSIRILCVLSMALSNWLNTAVAANKEAPDCSKERLVGMRSLALDHVSAQKVFRDTVNVGTAVAGTGDLDNRGSC